MKSKDAISRRDWLRSLFGSKRASGAEPRADREADEANSARVAVIMGRYCLAYERSFCTVCVERCPISGAITSTRGIPLVDPTLCDGCGICVELCPAPEPAIRMFPKRPPSSIAPGVSDPPQSTLPLRLNRMLGQREVS
jgi:Na+-translocating ferredoxin:NAD+ oxidoreductase RNF subunit RnfB